MSTRFVKDHGLTARMTMTMFVLGLLFVGLVVGLMLAVRGPLAIIIGLAGLGIAWFQWYNSDKVALKAMRARVVAPHEAPELHAMIDRLCAMADMPKPTVAIAYTDMPNAFATAATTTGRRSG
jgi:heat shock protein HtpX